IRGSRSGAFSVRSALASVRFALAYQYQYQYWYYTGMTTSSALLHPVRLRIVQALLGEGELTTHQLHEHLTDVPIATLYRHVAHLVRHDLIEVADEQRIRGTSEKTYRLASGFANPSAEEL